MVHSDVRRSPRTERTPSSPGAAALNLKSPIGKAQKMATPNKMSPSPARRMAAEQLATRSGEKAVKTPQRTASSSSAQRVGSAQNYKEKETLTVRLNVYDLVWNRNDDTGQAKNAAAGFENLGFGLYHSALEIWGKEISFGHSKRYKSGVFAVKPKRAQEYMPNTRFKISIEMETLTMSRHSMDKLLNRLAAKYTSDSYDVLRSNCNHFTEDLCMAICGKQIPDWINRPAKTGAAALEALNAPLKVLGNLFGQTDTDAVDTKATLDRLSQITQVPDTADLVVPENSAQKRAMGGSCGASSSGGSGVKSWLEHSGQTTPAWQGDSTPVSGNKENSERGSQSSPRSEKRRRIDLTDTTPGAASGGRGGQTPNSGAKGKTPSKTPGKSARGLTEEDKNAAQWY